MPIQTEHSPIIVLRRLGAMVLSPMASGLTVRMIAPRQNSGLSSLMFLVVSSEPISTGPAMIVAQIPAPWTRPPWPWIVTPPNTVIADETYGPDEWAGSYYHLAFVSDVTSLVQSGSHDYAVSGAGLDFMGNYGTGLMVVYEDAGLPLSYVVIGDGLDSFNCDYGAPQGPDSEVTFCDFAPDADDRSVDITLFAGGVENDSRSNSLWYQTGSGTKPTNLVDTASATELTEAPPPYPLIAELATAFRLLVWAVWYLVYRRRRRLRPEG